MRTIRQAIKAGGPAMMSVASPLEARLTCHGSSDCRSAHPWPMLAWPREALTQPQTHHPLSEPFGHAARDDAGNFPPPRLPLLRPLCHCRCLHLHWNHWDHWNQSSHTPLVRVLFLSLSDLHRLVLLPSHSRPTSQPHLFLHPPVITSLLVHLITSTCTRLAIISGGRSLRIHPSSHPNRLSLHHSMP